MEPRPAPPCTLVIFGASGDLTKRLLVPALYNLRRAKLLPQQFALIGIARKRDDDAGLRRDLGAALREFAAETVLEADWQWLAERMHYLQGEFDDPRVYKELGRRLGEIGNCLFYLATPPRAFGTIVRRLGEAGLASEAEANWRRVIIEKPFGTDLPSARALNREILGVLAESHLCLMSPGPTPRAPNIRWPYQLP